MPNSANTVASAPTVASMSRACPVKSRELATDDIPATSRSIGAGSEASANTTTYRPVVCAVPLALPALSLLPPPGAAVGPVMMISFAGRSHPD